MREGFRFDNLFKPNKKPPETGGRGRIFALKPPKLRLASEEEKTLRHKFYQITAVILVFLIGFITALGFIKKQAFIKEQPVIKLEKKADYILAEITGLAKVDPARAMGMSLDLKRSIGDFRKNIKDKKLFKRLESLQQKLNRLQSELGLVNQAKLVEFLDPNLVKEGIRAGILVGNNEILLIFDSQNNILATVSPVDRSGQVVGGGVEGINSVALGRNSAFGIKENRIIEFPFGGGEQAEAVKEEEPWGADPALAWFGGNLYVIDKSSSEILKYLPVETRAVSRERIVPEGERQAETGPATESGKFGSRRRWFKPGLNYDLSDMAAAEVDGDIWILHRDGKISRFRNGSRISFKQVLADFMVEPVLFSIPLDGERIWVLGRKEKKVVVLNKETGEFEGVWEADEFGKAQGLVVNEKLGKMFVLIEGKIYAVNIK